MTDPKEHIKQLRTRQENTDPSLLKALAGAINRLEKAFPEQWHFLMEFLQNADDCQSSSFSLELTEDRIQIYNDGRPFDYDDIESLCNVGHSSKAHSEKGEEYIGYLGVGFKSVFLISDNPRINSAGYQFKFDKEHWDDPSQIPWQITPLWMNNSIPQIPKQYSTAFDIPISDAITSETFDKLVQELSAEHISDTTVLFLKNLETVKIHDRINNVSKTIEKELLETNSECEIIRITVEQDGEKKTNKWLVFDNIVSVPEQVKDDPMTQRWERDNLDTREVRVAFKLDDNGLLQKHDGTAHMGVFSFLPLKEVPSGLNFLVQADFLTAPGRETIHRDAPWNRWLAREVSQLIQDHVVPTFKYDEKWKQNFTKILYPKEGGHSLFNEEIQQPLQEYLKDSPVILTTDGDFVKPSDCVTIQDSLKELISASDFSELYPDKANIHSDCETVFQLKNEMSDGPSFSSSKGLSNNMEALLELKSSNENISFFNSLYQLFGEWADSTLAGTRIRREPVVLTEECELKQPKEVSFPANGVTIPEQLRGSVSILHPDLRTSDILNTLTTLGVDEITQEDIEHKLQASNSLNLGRQWPKLDEKSKIDKTRECFELYLQQEIDVTDLDAIEVLTKNGEWLSPSSAIFSHEYNPEHRIEQLHDNGLVPGNPDFLSAEYLRSSDQVSQWRRFFEELGVDSNLDKTTFVEQIAVETALRFEETQGREAKALPRHEEVEGYDLESDGRVIEVKGSDSSSPSVRLTTKQFSRLKSDRDNYYLYIVCNTLSRPRLVEIKGENVLDVDRSIQINFDEIQTISESEYEVI